MDHEKILNYYATEVEKHRLEQPFFKLEGLRTKQIINRYVSAEKLKIADIGGGTGFYSFWLQEMGHSVTLVDLSPNNITLANEHAAATGIALTACGTGEATNLQLKNSEYDMVLLLGPLYHLVEIEERMKALSEAKRILKPDGVIIAATISRYASLLDGLKRNLVSDPKFEKLLIDDLNTGLHLNETDNFEYFTTAYFHTPDEIRTEILNSGLKLEKLLAVESIGWIVDDLESKISDPAYANTFYNLLNKVESNDDLLAVSPHILAVARKEI